MRYILHDHIGSANHGCEALVRTVSKLLGPGRTVLLSEAPEEDARYGVVRPLVVQDVRPARSDVIRKSSPAFWSAYLRLKLLNDYTPLDVLPYRAALQTLTRDDILVSIGGDVYCYEDMQKRIRLHNLARRYAGGSILLGCSIEPKLLRSKALLRDLTAFDRITARETQTLHALQSAGLRNVSFCPDSAFLLEPRGAEIPEVFQPHNTVGINVSPLLLRRARNAKLILDNLIALIGTILRTTDSAVALIPHAVQNGNDDRDPLKELYAAFQDSGRVCLIKDQSASQLKSIIALCSSFIGARTHAVIAAYSSGVPTLALGYSVKAKGLAEDIFGVDTPYVLPIENIADETAVTRRWIRLRIHASEITETLRAKTAAYEDALKAFRRTLQEGKDGKTARNAASAVL